MAVGVVEIDAVRVAAAAVDFDAGIFQRRLGAGIVAGRQAQRHVIDFAATVNVVAAVDFEQRDALAAAFQKTLPVAFMIDFHTEEVDVELSRTGEIFDVKDDVVDTRNFERRSHNPPPGKYRRKIRNPNIEIRNKLREKYISYRENPKHQIGRQLVSNFGFGILFVAS